MKYNTLKAVILMWYSKFNEGVKYIGTEILVQENSSERRIIVGIEVEDGIMLPKEIHFVLTWYLSILSPRPRRSTQEKKDNILISGWLIVTQVSWSSISKYIFILKEKKMNFAFVVHYLAIELTNKIKSWGLRWPSCGTLDNTSIIVVLYYI